MSDTLLSIVTLYTWDNTIFDNMVIPPELDKDILIDNLLMENAEFEVLYSDPDFMKLALSAWSKKELKKWQEKYDTTVLEYDPIENFNRTETGTETETRDLDKTNLETRDLSGSNNETRNITGSNDETRNLASTGSDNTVVDSELNRSGSDNTVTATSAYNETSTFTDKEKITSTLGTKEETDSTVDTTLAGSDTGTINTATTDAGSVNNAITDSGTVNNVEEDNGTITNERNLNMKGNIGVTTTQQMIGQERDIVEFNIYDYIIDSYKMKFSITVY